MLQRVITTKAVSLGLRRPPEKENVLEQGLPAVGTVRDLTGMPVRLYVRLSVLCDSFLMMKATNYKIGSEASDGVCHIQNKYFWKLK